MNDWFGERGLARPLTQAAGLDAWHPAIEEPDSTWGQLSSEVPRAILSSGGLAGASSVPVAVAGGVISGAARDPGADNSPRHRLVNALMGGAGAGSGALIGKSLGNIGEAIWLKTAGKFGADNVKKYGAFGEGYAGAKEMHGNPELFGKSLDQLPTGRGAFRRGIRPDHPTQLAEIAKLKEGDIWKPGNALSTDRYGIQSYEAAHGFINEADEFVAAGAAKRGPYIHIKSQNARDARPVLGWDEVITKPDASFRVDRIIRDADGNVTDMYVTDLSKAGLGRTAADAGKAGMRSVSGLSTDAAIITGNRADMARKASAHGRANQKRYDEMKKRRVDSNKYWGTKDPETGY